MTEIRNVGQEVQAEIMKTARKGQDAVVGAIRTWTRTVRSITPPARELNLPFANRLPRAEELAMSAYEFAQKLLASQRKFAKDMVHAATPMLPGIGTVRKAGRAGRAGAAREPGVAEKPATAPKAEAPGEAAAPHKAASAQKTGAARKAATHKAGPAGQKNGSAAR